ncbi:hypothetical protein MMB232_02540 [Brevundimonas subvibrioides]|uniref:Uncharacterized protein n=1 Tax=Brevundimonas subvibrioides (strain ATCC 15264 / DSM 4735 / LMG 14903 / NBRC 16000 / CB 81) TaxID=633149 RepID=D9QLP6_BRESC|nr:hypothetical protein [Brevundimonas subvibrioides]ADL01940.1 conserved hypothetical protein [Brevundimonas subvibrioides ATCC 15264]
MQLPNDNRVILAIGAAVAILAAIVLALMFGGKRDQTEAPPVDRPAGLQVDLADAPSLEPTRELRCFVDGQFVGMATLADCAQRNGLATDGLDVGLDASGNLSAAPTASFAPPPELPTSPVADLNDDFGNPGAPLPEKPGSQPQREPQVQRASGAPCLRYTGSEWRQISTDMSLGQCVQALYAGTCVRPGDAQYGQHGGLTLRLVPRRVEQSTDNSRFRILADQDRNCQFPSLN